VAGTACWSGWDWVCDNRNQKPDIFQAQVTTISLCLLQAISRARPSYSGVTTWASVDLAPLSAEADSLEGGGSSELDREGRCGGEGWGRAEQGRAGRSVIRVCWVSRRMLGRLMWPTPCCFRPCGEVQHMCDLTTCLMCAAGMC
jgi:hypothetical protein